MKAATKKKMTLVTVAVAIIIAGTLYFSKSRVKITIEKAENIDSAIAETVTKQSPLNREAKEHFKKAHELLKNKKLDEALKEFKQAAKLAPDAAVVHYWVGRAYYFKKEPERAIAKFKKVLDLEPKNYRALAMIGRILSLDKAKLDEAISYLNDALSINPDYAEARFDLGRIYAQKGDAKRALSEFAVIFMSEPRYALYHFGGGRFCGCFRCSDAKRTCYGIDNKKVAWAGYTINGCN